MKKLIRQIRFFIFGELFRFAIKFVPDSAPKTWAWIAAWPFEE